MPPANSLLDLHLLPLLPLRGAALKPGDKVPLFVGRPASVAAINSSAKGDKRVFAVAQLTADQHKPALKDLHGMGTVAEITAFLKLPDGTLKIEVTGLHAAQLLELVDAGDHDCARIKTVAAASDAELGVPPPPQKTERPDDIVEEVDIDDFDPAGDPVIRIERCGTLNLVFECLPPSWMKVDEAEELRRLKALDQGLIAAGGPGVIWDSMNICLVESPTPGAIPRIRQFLQSYRKTYDVPV